MVGQVSRKVGRRVVSESEKSWVAGCEEALSEKDKSAGRQRGWLAGNPESEWMQMGNVTTAPVFQRHVSPSLPYFVLSAPLCLCKVRTIVNSLNWKLSWYQQVVRCHSHLGHLVVTWVVTWGDKATEGHRLKEISS